MRLLDVLGDADAGPGEALAAHLAPVLFDPDAGPTELAKVGEFVHEMGVTEMQRETGDRVEDTGAELTLVLAAVEPLLDGLVALVGGGRRLAQKSGQDMRLANHGEGGGGQLEQRHL